MNNKLFSSFWMAGYECSDQLNIHGDRVDLQSATGHINLVKEDYQKLAGFHISTVREGIRWSQVERLPYKYDWSEVNKMIASAQTCGIQQIWDLCHFGFPSDLTPLHPRFTKRFVAMCYSFADNFFRHANGPLIVTPINEVSFLSWLSGEQAATVPYCTGSGWQVKYALMKAYIEGVAALKEKYPDVFIVSTEPLVNIVPPLNGTVAQIEEAAIANEAQFQATDMLTGRICPELGGRAEFLDILGLNYYYSNQYELGSATPLPWVNTSGDPRWMSLSQLMENAYNRYQIPIILAETSHPGEHRPNWINYVSDECSLLIRRSIPLLGICVYPIISRPDWDDPRIWHHSGLWDVDISTQIRTMHSEYAEALIKCQQQLASDFAASVISFPAAPVSQAEMQ